MFKKTEKVILLKEIEKLRKENKSLMTKLEVANKSKNDYDKLVIQLNECKEKYKNSYKNLKNLESEFEKIKNRFVNGYKYFDTK